MAVLDVRLPDEKHVGAASAGRKPNCPRFCRVQRLQRHVLAMAVALASNAPTLARSHQGYRGGSPSHVNMWANGLEIAFRV